ncbi:ThiF family adenylyltransferase [Salinigranum marinum]|uniref:HesA/MoeB/ThiF family protein n=1 Tax=Salinigranum marinum TaxID=1515595 RepID=UPI0031BA231B
MHVFDDAACAVQEADAVRPALKRERDRLGQCLNRGQVPVLVHSHPWSRDPEFSERDDEIMTAMAEWLGGLCPESTLAFAVIGSHGMATAVYEDFGAGERRPLPVTISGDWKLSPPLDCMTRDAPTSTVDTERYDRSIRALSLEGQQRLADSKIAVVGLGGLGSVVATELARLGVCNFLLVDHDCVERSNLPRIYGAYEEDIGRPKVDVVGDHLQRIDTGIEVITRRCRVQDLSVSELWSCRVLVGAVDSLGARLFLNEFAVRHLLTYVDGGTAIKTDGTDDRIAEERGLVQLVAPGATACFDCLGRRDAEQLRIEQLGDAELQEEIQRGYVDADVRAPQPAIAPLNGVVASAITRTVTKVVTEYDHPADYLRFDGRSDELVSVTTHPNAACVTCGVEGVLGHGRPVVDEGALMSNPETAVSLENAQTVTEADGHGSQMLENSSPSTEREDVRRDDDEVSASLPRTPSSESKLTLRRVLTDPWVLVFVFLAIAVGMLFLQLFFAGGG